MNPFEKARELGNLLLETEEAKKLNGKRYIFESDEQAQRKLFEYSRQRDELQMKIHSGALSKEEIADEQEKLKKKAGEVMLDPVIRDMFAAEEEFSALVDQVMDILRATIDGSAEGGCTGRCSGCSGCH